MKRRTFLHLPLIGAASAAAAPDAAPVRLGMLADPHYADRDAATTLQKPRALPVHRPA